MTDRTDVGPFSVVESAAWVLPAGLLIICCAAAGLGFLFIQASAPAGLSCAYRSPIALGLSEALGIGAALMGLAVRGSTVTRVVIASVGLVVGGAVGYGAVMSLFSPVCF